MEKRNISISLEKAEEWYEGGDITLKQPALEAYSEEGLKKKTTYSDVLDGLWRSDKLVTDQISISSITTSGVGKIKVLGKLYNKEDAQKALEMLSSDELDALFR